MLGIRVCMPLVFFFLNYLTYDDFTTQWQMFWTVVNLTQVVLIVLNCMPQETQC